MNRPVPDEVKVPEGAIAGDLIRFNGTPIGVVLEVQDDGRALVKLDFYDVVANVPREGEERVCDSCESEEVYHDKNEEWVCPWCDL